MSPNFQLVLHNVLSIISAIVALGMALFIFINGKKRTANRALSLTMIFVAIFAVSHVIGVNISDPKLSMTFLMFNLSMFLIASTNVHAISALVGENIKKKWFIIFFYISSIAFIIAFIIFPDLFLLPSTSKMYFPNYYVPGAFNWVRIAFMDVIALFYMLYILFKAYKNSESKIEKKHYMYSSYVIFVGYFIGFIPNFLVYNINIDPLLGMSFAILFAVPLASATIKYELFDVRIIAKQAFFYAIGITVIGGIIILLNYLNNWIINFYPNYPSWATIIISSVLTMTIGILVWKNLRKGDLLRHEFITTVTHKFRTPLTGIKWATENLSDIGLPEEAKKQLEYIKTANERLVGLTDLLVTSSESERNIFEYIFKYDNLSPLCNTVISSYNHQISSKKLIIEKDIENDLKTSFDFVRMKFVIQTLTENAINYTKNGGKIIIKAKKENNDIVFSVEDTGIGMNKKELSLVFSKFYRASEARNVDTEGMGIGLYLAKEIINNHKGKMWVKSEGLDKGSIFGFSIPIREE